MESVYHVRENREFASPEHFIRAYLFTDFPTRLHDHNFYELLVVTQGRGQHRIGNAVFPVSQGDVFVVPPMVPHSFFDPDNLEVINILIRVEFIRERQAQSANFPGYFKFMETEPFLRQNYDKSMFLHLSPAQLRELRQDINLIDDSSPLCQRGYSELQHHITWKIIYYLSYLLDKQLNTDSTTAFSKYENQILNTLEYIHKNFSQKLSVEGLAARVFLSKSTFLRNFQTLCGCSPIQYLSQYRIKKAEELLSCSKKSKTEIAHLCGFYDLSHMERCMKSNRPAVQG